MSPLILTLLLSCVSGALAALGTFVRPARKPAAVLLLLWLAAALPLMFFRNLPAENVLLFYTLSAALGLLCSIGGRKT